MISIVILTFNSELSIGRTLEAARRVSDKIYVVDSYSTDRTLNICQEYRCRIVQRAFTGYSDQRNWAMENLPIDSEWQLHIDADEELEPELAKALAELDLSATQIDGYIVGRKIVFLGRVLRFGGINKTWHCRLFRPGKARCEDRLYDQHFICDGRVEEIQAFMLDHQQDGLNEWTARHNRWSDLEAKQLVTHLDIDGATLRGDRKGNPIERKRYYKGIYYKLPIFWRSLAYFLYRYLFRLGFLDGTRGLIYHVLQGFWFRFLVDAKILENRLRVTSQRS